MTAYSTPDSRQRRNERRIREATGLSDGEMVSVLATVRFLSTWDDATTEAICRLLTTVRANERKGLF